MSSPGLSTAWELRTRRAAYVFAATLFVVLNLLVLLISGESAPLWLGPLIAAVPTILTFLGMTRKIRRRRRILTEPFPAEWEIVLRREVVFYRALDPGQQQRFRRELQLFLREKRITGIKTDIDHVTLVLAGVSAIIPIFGFHEWEWDQISEVLIYPARFDESFEFGQGGDRQTLGMVGTGAMDGLMILSKPDLHHGFRNAGDKRNVGLHEFAHLVDKSDGTIDGLPGVGLNREAIGPWIDLVRRKMAEMRRGDSDIDPYGLTNEAEFFAVTTEYFFERPGIMQRKHPELYRMLSRVFKQDLVSRVKAMTRARRNGRPKFGRNSPCPCGSGRKFKRCCRTN